MSVGQSFLLGLSTGMLLCWLLLYMPLRAQARRGAEAAEDIRRIDGMLHPERTRYVPVYPGPGREPNEAWLAYVHEGTDLRYDRPTRRPANNGVQEAVEPPPQELETTQPLPPLTGLSAVWSPPPPRSPVPAFAEDAVWGPTDPVEPRLIERFAVALWLAASVAESTGVALNRCLTLKLEAMIDWPRKAYEILSYQPPRARGIRPKRIYRLPSHLRPAPLPPSIRSLALHTALDIWGPM